jgi:RNA polymerase sigma-70 factor (ECF subfamily)
VGLTLAADAFTVVPRIDLRNGPVPRSARTMAPSSERLQQLLDASGERLRSVARRLCRNDADAHDLVQDTWERAVRAHAKDSALTLTEAWLTTVLHNAFIDLCRKRKREGTKEEVETVAIAAPEPERAAAWAEITPAQLTAAIAKLPEEFASVYSLFANGASYTEIADKLGIQKATVGTRISRARARLRSILLGGDS